MKREVFIFFIVCFFLTTIVLAQTESVDVTAEIEIIGPVLSIISPENITYNSNTGILLDFVAINADSIWYNLDNTANTTIASSTSFSTSWGAHILFLFASNSSGNSSRNVTFAVVEPPDTSDPDNSDGNGGNGGTFCAVTWECTEWNNFEQSCGTRDCSDINSCRTNVGKPDETFECPDQGVAPQNPYCGDGNCDEDESFETCENDCTEGNISTGNKLVKKSILLTTLAMMILALIVLAIIFTRKALYTDRIESIMRVTN